MTTVVATSQTLDDRIAVAEAELQDAEREVGAVVLDGGDSKAAGKRVADARAALDGFRFACAEQAAREAAESERITKHNEEVARWRYLSRHMAYLERIRPVLTLREQLHEAEQRVVAIPSSRSNSAHFNGVYYEDARWLDKELDAGRLPNPTGIPTDPRLGSGRADTANLTFADCDELEAELKPLLAAAAKAAGPDAKPDALPW